MRYQDPPDFTPGTTSLLSSTDPKVVCEALLSICLYSGNYDLSIEAINSSLHHENKEVKRLAITCIGHVSRLWKNVPKELIEFTEQMWQDRKNEFWGTADDTIDDFEVFLKGYKRPTPTLTT
jgi:hypothetical protein